MMGISCNYSKFIFHLDYLNIKRRYWILYYVIAACDFVSCPYPCILRRILVFIRQFIRVPFLMLHLLSSILSDSIRYFPILYYPIRWVRTLVRHPVRPSGGWHKNRGVAGIEWVSARV